MSWAAEWENHEGDTREELWRWWSERVEQSRRVVAAPFGAGEAEYAQHNDHAGLLRQAIDGLTGE